MGLPGRDKKCRKRNENIGPFRKVSEVYVLACESTFGELAGERNPGAKHNWIYNLV